MKTSSGGDASKRRRGRDARAAFSLTIAHGGRHKGFLEQHLHAARAMLDARLIELSIAVVGDEAMADLHWRFMRVKGPTDVLTFELDHDAGGRVTSGEVVVCIDEARRRAKEIGVPARREMLLYALHGMLHLCGFDDRTPADYRKMHAKEDQILTALGLGAVFAAGKAGAS